MAPSAGGPGLTRVGACCEGTERRRPASVEVETDGAAGRRSRRDLLRISVHLKR